MVFIRRTPARSDRWLKWKMALLGLAAVAFWFGVRLEQRWLVWVAAGLVLLGFLLRFAPAESHEDEAGDDS